MIRVDEEVAYHERYLVVEPNLDETAWRLNGRLAGVCGPDRDRRDAARRHVRAQTGFWEPPSQG
jgi:hypothetical protein